MTVFRTVIDVIELDGVIGIRFEIQNGTTKQAVIFTADEAERVSKALAQGVIEAAKIDIHSLTKN